MYTCKILNNLLQQLSYNFNLYKRLKKKSLDLSDTIAEVLNLLCNTVCF